MSFRGDRSLSFARRLLALAIFAAAVALTAPTSAMAQVCGDGTVDVGEECDDGGVIAGDCAGGAAPPARATPSPPGWAPGGGPPGGGPRGESGAVPPPPPPADLKSLAVCRPAASACDVAESCNGSSNTCPADVIAPSG